MIGIIDIGIGTPKSIFNAFKFLGVDSALVTTPNQLSEFNKIVLPGVGNFGAFSYKLGDIGFSEVIQNIISHSNIPFLGICVGAQMLLNKSDESDHASGLGLIPGNVIKIGTENGQKIPNIGWRKIDYVNEENKDFDFKLDRFYFSHSYRFNVSREFLFAETISFRIPAIIKKENVIGVQFHPEKSGNFGLNFLNKFAQR